MKDHIGLLAEKRTHLAEKRTELAYERTVLAYFRTAATFILFGITFLGLSGVYGKVFLYAGWAALFVGIIFMVVAVLSGRKHLHEIKMIREFFDSVVHFSFKRKKE